MQSNYLVMKYFIVIYFISIISIQSFASTTAEIFGVPTDTILPLNLMNRSNFSGQARSFFMNTINEGSLSDFHALGIGAGLSYRTEFYKHLEFGTSGFFVFNLLSNDLGKRDSFSNQASRYEIGLFDIEDPKNKENMDRLEELYGKVVYLL